MSRLVSHSVSVSVGNIVGNDVRNESVLSIPLLLSGVGEVHELTILLALFWRIKVFLFRVVLVYVATIMKTAISLLTATTSPSSFRVSRFFASTSSQQSILGKRCVQ